MFHLQASFGAAAAYKDARHTRDAVGKTLSDINNLLGSIGMKTAYSWRVQLRNLLLIHNVCLTFG